MAFAVTLRFDPAIAAFVRQMWDILAAAGLDHDRAQLGYAPHITLAVYPDEAPADRLTAATERLARRWRALPVTLAGFGVFPGTESFLWLAPVTTGELLDRHAAVQAAFPDLPVHPHYRCGAWLPHVTLSGAMAHPERALAALLPCWRPVAGILDTLDLVRFRPVTVMQSHPLERRPMPLR